jgi:hypothetical protein
MVARRILALEVLDPSGCQGEVEAGYLVWPLFAPARIWRQTFSPALPFFLEAGKIWLGAPCFHIKNLYEKVY